MGGFLNKNETVDEAANHVLNTLTGLHDVYLKQLHVFSEVNCDPVELLSLWPIMP